LITVSAVEVTRLQAIRPGARLRHRPDGTAVVVVPEVRLPTGWSRRTTCVRWLLSPAYPAAQPDCFCTDPDLRIEGGAIPRNAFLQVLDGEAVLWFSWHLQGAAWRPGRDDVLKYLRFVEQRFTDVR
jgi:E2/UBC family protein E